jgi:hypothetical protein
MSKKKTNVNRKSGNAGQKKGPSQPRAKKSKTNLRQGAKVRRVPKGGKPFDDARKQGASTRSSYDHARPIENRKGKHHTRHRQKVPNGARQTKTGRGHYPKQKANDGKKWVPWVEVNVSAQAHHYAFVIREMLESPDEPVLGTQQLDLHGRDRSVESVLTQTPRLRRDWRTFVGVLRILHEDNYIPASFVEKMLSSHPLTGARSVKVVEDESVSSDYVKDKCTMSNKSWVKDAQTSYTHALKRVKTSFVEQKVKELQQVLPDLDEQQYLTAANTAWDNDDSPTMVGLKTEQGIQPCDDKKSYIKAHMVKRARKDAAKNPRLYRLSGGVRYKTMENNKIVEKGDFVNIEYAVLNTGKVWMAVCNGNKKNTNSPFRKHYLLMKGNASEESFIDDFDVPKQVNHTFIQRPVVPEQPVITEDMTVGETLAVMSKQQNVSFTDLRFVEKREKKVKKQSRKVAPLRGTPRKAVKHDESPQGEEDGA